MTERRLGAYELLDEIGRGGMGVVYRARQPSLHRMVAVKVLGPHLASDRAFLQRFLREARAAARLEHPGIVTVYDVGEEDGTYYFAMQLLPGDSLAELLASTQRLAPNQVASLGIQVGDALSYAHRAQILHRDIKPGNLLIDRDGRSVLSDFGIALATTDTRLTRTGASLGSPDYMPPEVVNGKNPDSRSDLYSLGIVLFEALTGDVPYKGANPMAVAYQHVSGRLPRVREVLPEAPEEMDRIIGRLMAKDPDERYQSAAEVVEDLLAVTGGVVTALPSVGEEGRTLSTSPVSPSPATAPGDTVVTGGASAPPDTADRTPVPTPAPIQRKHRSPLRLGLAIVLAGLAVAAAVWVARERPWQRPRTGVPAAGPTTTPVGTDGAGPVEPPPAPRRTLAVESEPPGLAIRVDGVALGLITPATVDIEAPEGAETRIELLSGGDSVASRTLVVGAEMPSTWRAVVPPQERFAITSDPAGAEVSLSGEKLEGVTPLEVDLRPGRDYRLRLELAGYEPGGMELTLEGLPEELRRSGQLHFPLAPTTPPGFLRARADYPATLRVDGRRVASGRRLELPPGTYRVEVSAPSVYHAARHTVRIRSGEESVLELPATVSVAVAAAPSRCRVKIDGRDVDFVPFTIDLALGKHRFDFEWDQLQTSRTIEEEVTLETRRVFAAAGEPQ